MRRLLLRRAVLMNTLTVKVPVRAELPGDVYRTLEQLARKHDVTVGRILEDLGTKFVRGAQPKKPWRRPYLITPEKERVLREMHGNHHADVDIAAVLGVSVGTVGNARRRLGLEPLKSHGGRPRKNTNQEKSTAS